MKMQDLDHRHPQTGTAFGQNYYDTGVVAADGGRDLGKETMADVDHEPPSKGASRCFKRGTKEHERSV